MSRLKRWSIGPLAAAVAVCLSACALPAPVVVRETVEATRQVTLPPPISTPTPSPTRTDTPTPTATPVPADRTAPMATPVSATRTTPTPPPLTFTWRAGAFRSAGRNAQGVGIWKQEIVVEPLGGVPPNTVIFEYAGGGRRLEGTTLEIEGLSCIGQVGTITVESSDGQIASQRITLNAPICPTKTPTPTSTSTRTWTPPPTPTPLVITIFPLQTATLTPRP